MRPILLIEDTEDDVFFMQRALKKAGVSHPLKVAADGQLGLDYLEGKNDFANREENPEPCLVLLDLKLPKLNGLEVLKWIRQKKQYSTLPVIILTSSREDRDIQEAYALGANSYKVKPPDSAELADFALAMKKYWLEHDQSCSNQKAKD